jgi:hypothetical protein
MCELGMILSLGSTLLGAVGSIQQANAQAAAAEYNAKIGEMNAQLSERRARDAIERGAAEEQRKRMEVARLQGQQKAAMAANGVDLGFGSPLDTIVDTAVLGELDALTIRTNAYRESYDRQVDAVNQRAGAELNRMEAKAAKTGGYLAAAGTVLGGVGNAYSSYRQSTMGRIA